MVAIESWALLKAFTKRCLAVGRVWFHGVSRRSVPSYR